jgi:hypothetical protein
MKMGLRSWALLFIYVCAFLCLNLLSNMSRSEAACSTHFGPIKI